MIENSDFALQSMQYPVQTSLEWAELSLSK